MGDLLRTGSDWLEGQRHAHMSREVVYSRGETEITLDATVGTRTFQQDDGDGGFLEFTSRDYLVRASDLSALGEPAAGDVIRETIGSTVLVCRVGAPLSSGGSVPAFEYSDPGRLTFRIHTDIYGEEVAP